MPLDGSRPRCPAAKGGQNSKPCAERIIPIRSASPTAFPLNAATAGIARKSTFPSLRSYQAAAVETVFTRLAVVDEGRLLRGYIELPTGAGKTAVAGTVAGWCLSINSHRPVLFLAHRRELVRQQAAELTRWSGFPVSVLMAGEEFDPSASLVVASIQTLMSRLEAFCVRPGLILIDECHHAFAGSQVDQLLRQLGDVPAIGLSATPRRSWERPSPILTECLFARGLPELIAAGVLAPLRSERIEAPMVLAEIITRHGDYAGPALAVEAERPEVIAAIVQAAAPRLLERPGPALCFGVTVEHARRLAASFAYAGIRAVCVWGEQAETDRAAAFNAWRAGEAQLLVNCAIVSEGIDLPALQTIIVARPTRSRRLYQQIIGRGTRQAPGKTECLVLEACAVRPDPGQVLLGTFIPEHHGGGGGRPMLRLLDPDAAGKWTWQLHASSGAFSVPADVGCRVYLVPEPGGSGLYRAVLHHRGEPFRELTTSLAQAEAMHRAGEWLAQNASLDLAASTRWHAEPASLAQLELLHRHGIDAARLTRRQASELISDAVAARIVPLIVGRLWPREGS